MPEPSLTTITVRVSEETKQLFNEFAKGSDTENKGDFVKDLLTAYQAAKLIENSPIIKPAVETANYMHAQYIEILSGIGAEIEVRNLKHGQEIEEQQKSFESTRTLLQDRIVSLEESLGECEERGASILAEMEVAEKKNDGLLEQIKGLTEQINQLQSSLKDKDDLVNVYKNKNDALSGVVLEYQSAAEENKSLKGSISDLEHANLGLETQIGQLNNEIKTQTNNFNSERDNLRNSFLTEQENLRNSLLIQNEKTILELKQELQTKLGEQQAKYSQTISGYEDKVRSLLEDLEQAKKRPAVSLKKGTGKRDGSSQSDS